MFSRLQNLDYLLGKSWFPLAELSPYLYIRLQI